MKILSIIVGALVYVSPLFAQWEFLNVPYYADNVTDISITEYPLPARGKVIYVADSSFSSLLKSTDQGESWTHLPGTAPLKVVAEPGNQYVVYKAIPGEGIWKSTDGGQTWSAKNNGINNLQTTVLAISPFDSDILYAGCTNTIGGFNVVFRTTDGGQTWIGSNDFDTPFADITDIEFDPTDNQIVYITSTYNSNSGKGGIYKTIDGGDNWVEKNTGLISKHISSISVVSSANNIAYSANIISSPNYIYKTIDGGDNWTDVYNTSSYIRDLATASNGDIYASIFGGGVIKSTNNGSTWNSMNNGIVDLFTQTLAIDPWDENNVYLGTRYTFYKSIDSGNSWNEKVNGMVKQNIRSISLSGSNIYTVTGTDHLLSVSIDSGISWLKKVLTSILGWESYDILVDPELPSTLFEVGWADPDCGYVNKSTDSAETWNIVLWYTACDPDGWFYTVKLDPINTSRVYVVGNRSKHPDTGDLSPIFRSDDLGSTWNTVGSWTGGTLYDLVVNPLNNNVMYSTYESPSTVKKTVDEGVTWSNKDNGLPTSPGWKQNSLAIDNVDPDIIYATTTSGVYKTVNGGDSWYAANSGITFTNIYAVSIHPEAPQILYVASHSGSNGYVYESVDKGNSWTEIGSGLSNTKINDLVIDINNSTYLYAGTEGGVYKYGMPPSPPENLQVAAQNNRPHLTWDFNPESNITGYKIFRKLPSENFIEIASVPSSQNYYTDTEYRTSNFGDYIYYHIKAENSIPKISAPSNQVQIKVILLNKKGNEALVSEKTYEYRLERSYPNPFNPETRIIYSLKERSNVRIAVYDIMGRKVQTLLESVMDRGTHEVLWRGKNYLGVDVGSGLYIYEISAVSSKTGEKFVDRKKMSLLR